MAESKDEILLKLKIEENRALKKLKEVKESVNNLDRRTKKYKNTVREQVALESKLIGIRKQRVIVNKQVEDSTKKLTKATKEGKTANGAATSATLELGRVLSDAPYGIRGVANNLQQLASNLFFMSKRTDDVTGKMLGFKGAVGSVLKGLIGPAGILIAFQGAIALLDYFKVGMGKAEESLNSFRVTASESAVDLKSLLIVMNEDMLSKEDLANVVDKVNEKYKDLNISIDEEGKLTKESRIQIDKKIKSMGKLALANAMMAEIEKKQSEIAKAAVEMQEDTSKDLEKLGLEDLETFKQRQDETEEAYIKRMNALGKHQKGYYKGEIDVDRVNRIARVRRQVKNFEETKERVEKQTKELLKISTTEGFFDSFFDSKNKETGKKDKKISPFKTPDELDIDIKNADNALLRYDKQLQDARLKKELNDKLSEATSEEERRKIREAYQLDRLRNQLDSEKKMLELKLSTEKAVVKAKTKDHVDELKRKYTEFITELGYKEKLKQISKEDADKLRGEASGTLFDSIVQANNEEIKSIKEVEDKYTSLILKLQELGIVRKDALISSFGAKKDDADEEDGIDFAIEQYKILQSGLTDFLSGEYDRQMTIEQNKTNAMNNQLRERLNNENLSAGERKNIQLQIARNDEELRKKQEKIEKKRFKMQKAINIANGLVDVYSSGIKAYGSQLIIGDPTSPLRAQIAQGVALAAGMANIAMIARQKFQSSAGATVPAGSLGAGGGSGGGDRSFNFNLAGASQENQLAQTLQGRFDQPLQAYVVSRDITNQQQLDMDIQNNASFG